MNELREGLKAEIRFWGELLEASELNVESPEHQRIEDALELARRKLADSEQWLTQAALEQVEH